MFLHTTARREAETVDSKKDAEETPPTKDAKESLPQELVEISSSSAEDVEEIPPARVDPLVAAVLSHPALTTPAAPCTEQPLQHIALIGGVYAQQAVAATTGTSTTPPAQEQPAETHQSALTKKSCNESKVLPKKQPAATRRSFALRSSSLPEKQPPPPTSTSSSSRDLHKMLPPWRESPTAGSANFDWYKISKALSWILRHGARVLKIKISSEGFVPLSALQLRKPFQGMSVHDFQELCNTDSKQRYQMKLDGKGKWLIAANSSHTIPGVLGTAVAKVPPSILIHGSYWEHHQSIQQHGLCRMHRSTHLMDPQHPNYKWRANLTMKVTVDTQLALQAGCVFRHADNDVWLCDSTIPPAAICSFDDWDHQ